MPSYKLRIRSILYARCPSCHVGSVFKEWLGIRSECANCGYRFHREPGFFLGAMMMGFLVTAMLTIPPMILLKLMGAEPILLVVFPFVEFAVLGPILIIYMRVLWLHVEFLFSKRID